MTSYEQGSESPGVPVVYRLVQGEGRWNITSKVDVMGDFVDLDLSTEMHKSREIDAICRAFHLAKLAEDYANATEWKALVAANRALTKEAKR